MAAVDELIRQIKVKKPNLASKTIETYRFSLLRLKKLSVSFEVAPIMKHLQTLSAANARNLLTPLLILYPDRFRQPFNSFSESVRQKYESQRPSAKQEKQIVSPSEIQRLIRRLREDVKTHRLFTKQNKNIVEKRHLFAYVLFSLLLDVTMRNDCNTIKFAKKTADIDQKHNWFVLSTGTLALNVFKTARSFRRRGMLPLLIRVKPKTLLLLRKFTRHHTSGDWLFSLNNGKQMSKHQISSILTGHSFRYLGVRLGTNMLRHLVLSRNKTKQLLQKSQNKKQRPQKSQN